MVSKKNNTRQIFDFRSHFFFTAPQKSWHSMKTHQNQANQPTSRQNWKTFLQNWKTFLQNSILAPLTPLKSPDGPQTLPTCSYHEYYRFWDFQRIPTSITWKIEVFGSRGGVQRRIPRGAPKSIKLYQIIPKSSKLGFWRPLTPSECSDWVHTLRTWSTHELRRFWEFQRAPISLTIP